MNWYSMYKRGNEQQQNVVKDWLETMRNMRKTDSLPPEFVYAGLEDLLLQHGRKYESQPLTAEEMTILKNTIKNAWKYVSRQCYYNSQVIATSSKGLIKYVEGVAFCKLIPMNHAWNTINGKVLDFTWKSLNNSEPVLGILPDGWEYYGLEFPISKQEMRDYIKKHKEVKTFLDDWKGGHQILKRPFQAISENSEQKSLVDHQ